VAKRKKKSQSIELDSILEQFKKTYSSDSYGNLEDSLLETPESEEDEEINSILSKIFASEKSMSERNGKAKDIEEDENKSDSEQMSDEIVTEIVSEDKNTDDEANEDVAEADEDIVSETESEPEAVEENASNDTLSAQNEVDNVLSVMLGGAEPSDNDECQAVEDMRVIDEIVEDSLPDEEDILELDDGIDYEEESELENDLQEKQEPFEYADEDFAVADEEYDVSDESDVIEAEIVESEPIEEEFVEEDDLDEEVVEAYLPDEAVSERIDVLVDEIEDSEECVDNVSAENENVISETEVSPEENDVVEKICHLVLSPDEYTYDPLQEGLATFGTTRDARVLKVIDLISDEAEKNEEARFDDSDISLLLKLGYDKEIKAEVGGNVTEQILLDRDAYFAPEAHKKPFGYCGKEFSDRSQTNEIKKKYRSDKRACLLKLISVSVIAVIILSLYVFFEFFSDHTSYPLVMLFEMFLVALIAVILHKKLYSGILGIIKFEANLYSLSVFALIAYMIYDIVILMLYAIKQGDVDTSSLMLFGVTVAIYVILTLVSDLLNCIRESGTFDIMTAEDRIYTAEHSEDGKKDNTISKVTKSNENTYRICNTAIVSGYFRKISQGKIGAANLIYLIGIVPVLSLIIGCVSALVGGSIMNGASTVMFTALLCIPMAYVLMPSATEFIISKKMKSDDTAFIGTDAVGQYVKTDAIVFKDTDAVEITAFKDIRPSNSDENERYLMIAREVFESLGGTLADLSESYDEVKESKVIMNEITENGVELYFNESINVLMGNKQYMHTHKIKVKTDANLNAATKGADCSVIYMAFDGVPKLGFIINSKIKSKFADVSSLLETNGIRILVESYEPHINDVFFEQNKSENSSSVAVIRPDEYELSKKRYICDGEIISSRDSLSVAKAISLSRKILGTRKKNQRMHLALVVAGFILSCLLTLLINLTDSFAAFEWLRSHITLVFNIFMLWGLVPGVISLMKLEKDKFN